MKCLNRWMWRKKNKKPKIDPVEIRNMKLNFLFSHKSFSSSLFKSINLSLWHYHLPICSNQKLRSHPWSFYCFHHFTTYNPSTIPVSFTFKTYLKFIHLLPSLVHLSYHHLSSRLLQYLNCSVSTLDAVNNL